MSLGAGLHGHPSHHARPHAGRAGAGLSGSGDALRRLDQADGRAGAGPRGAPYDSDRGDEAPIARVRALLAGEAVPEDVRELFTPAAPGRRRWRVPRPGSVCGPGYGRWTTIRSSPFSRSTLEAECSETRLPRRAQPRSCGPSRAVGRGRGVQRSCPRELAATHPVRVRSSRPRLRSCSVATALTQGADQLRA